MNSSRGQAPRNNEYFLLDIVMSPTTGGTVMDSVILEIRAAEGGDDAKALVLEQMSIYVKVAGRRKL
jgi:protein subunit release factor A